ncbi:MAG: DUF3467 domain-containing protein [Aureliella sp.]
MDSPKFEGTPTVSPNGLASKPTIEAAQPEVDDSKSTAWYANFCRLSGTPEELLIDFGLNSHPMANTPQEVMVTQRVVAGWHTAKRLLHVLQQSVARHEAMFGVLETDVQKRVRRA